MITNRRQIALGLPLAFAAWPNLAHAADDGEPPQTVAFGSTGKIITFGPGQAHKTIAAALMTAKAGDVVRYPATEPRGQLFHESVGVPDCVTLDLGGRLTGGGTATPTWTAGAILDGAGLAYPGGYVQKMGGIVALGSLLVMGAEARGFGTQATAADGTAGIRAAGSTIGRIVVDHCYLHGNQSGIGPGGARTSITVINSWLHDNQLDPTGMSHNIYATEKVTSLIFGPGVTSTESPMIKGGGGHAVKSRARNFTKIIGPCFLYSGDESCVDIPDGSAELCSIGPGVILAKTATDQNNTLLGYGAESQRNGTAGVECHGVTFIAACANPDILNNGPVSFDAACKFTGNKVVATRPSLAVGLP